jgi:hypothetical protein
MRIKQIIYTEADILEAITAHIKNSEMGRSIGNAKVEIEEIDMEKGLEITLQVEVEA